MYKRQVQGIPVCFDAKECACDSFPLQNIHEHQVAFMRDFEKQQGIAFLILYFSHRDETVSYTHLDVYKRQAQNHQKKDKESDSFHRGSPCFRTLSLIYESF